MLFGVVYINVPFFLNFYSIFQPLFRINNTASDLFVGLMNISKCCQCENLLISPRSHDQISEGFCLECPPTIKFPSLIRCSVTVLLKLTICLDGQINYMKR